MLDMPTLTWLREEMDEKIAAAFAARGADLTHAMALAGAARLRARSGEIYYETDDATIQGIAVDIFNAMSAAK